MPKELFNPNDPPFAYIGVDFFGQFCVKRGRSRDKVYGCLFIYFISRAVPIEDARSLKTDALIQALLGFISSCE